jgi:hypothetical protein
MEEQKIVTTEFNLYNYGFLPITTVPITIYKPIVVYGFSYKTLEFAHLERLTQARMAKNKEYDENFTVQFINEAVKSCVAEYKFVGKLQFDTEVKVDFPQPFLAEKSTPHSLKVEFHHQHSDRKYQLFYKETKDGRGYLVQWDYNIIDGNNVTPRFPYINKLFYKVV